MFGVLYYPASIARWCSIRENNIKIELRSYFHQSVTNNSTMKSLFVILLAVFAVHADPVCILFYSIWLYSTKYHSVVARQMWLEKDNDTCSGLFHLHVSRVCYLRWNRWGSRSATSSYSTTIPVLLRSGSMPGHHSSTSCGLFHLHLSALYVVWARRKWRPCSTNYSATIPIVLRSRSVSGHFHVNNDRDAIHGYSNVFLKLNSLSRATCFWMVAIVRVGLFDVVCFSDNKIVFSYVTGKKMSGG